MSNFQVQNNSLIYILIRCIFSTKPELICNSLTTSFKCSNIGIIISISFRRIFVLFESGAIVLSCNIWEFWWGKEKSLCWVIASQRPTWPPSPSTDCSSRHSSMVWARSTWHSGTLTSPIWSCFEKRSKSKMANTSVLFIASA